MKPRRRIILASGAAASLALLEGCSFARTPPVKGTFLLEPAMPPPVGRTQPGALRVGTVNVAAAFRGRSFVVRETDLKYEADYYYEFLTSPGAIIGDATARAMSAARVFATVVPLGIPAETDWMLEGYAGAIYADARNAAAPAAVMQISYFLSRVSSGSGTPFWTRSYERRVGFEPGNTNRHVAAMSTALSEILSELAKDLSAATLPAS